MVLNKTALKTCLSFGVNGLQERFMDKIWKKSIFRTEVHRTTFRETAS